jgi:hypothetical protein
MDHVLNLDGMRQDTHWITIGIAAVVVLTVQPDVNAVIDRLSIDNQFRNTVADGWVRKLSTDTTGATVIPKPAALTATVSAPSNGAA